ncbi:MAG: hypothetical protein ACYDBZ_18885 [Steroidobacteraceae bacterium]
MLLQELPTKMVRHVIKSVTWADVDAPAASARRRFVRRKSPPEQTSATWQFYYLTNGARIVLLRKIRSLISRLGR